MKRVTALKAIADDTRMKIVILLLKHNYCVRALAKELDLSESTISQHLKVLREANLLIGEKRGHFMHYDVERSVLRELAKEIETLADIERKTCIPENGGCKPDEHEKRHVHDECSDETKEFCHGTIVEDKECSHHGNCKCHKS